MVLISELVWIALQGEVIGKSGNTERVVVKTKIWIGVVFVIAAFLALAVFTFRSHRLPETTLIVFPEIEAPVTYDEPIELLDGGTLQQVIFEDGDDYDALGVRSYQNSMYLSAEEWVREVWDPDRLLILDELPLDVGDAVLISDVTEWGMKQEGLTDFPVVAVVKIDNRVLVIDRLNGVETTPEQIINLIKQAQFP